MKSVAEMIEEQLKAATDNGEVDKRVVDNAVEARLARRAELLEWGVDTQKSINKEIAGIVPGTKGYTVAGEEVKDELYTKCQVDSLNRLNANLAELTTAVDARDFDALSRLQRKGFTYDNKGKCCG